MAESTGPSLSDRLKRDGRILYRAGLQIFPVGKGKKPTRKWKQGHRNFVTEMATQDDLREWLADSRTLGWSVLAGPLTNVLVLDVESAGMHYAQIAAVLAALPEYARRKSPNGGEHAYVRLVDAPEDFDWSGHALAKVKVTSPVTGKPDGHTLLAEVRGVDQYAVVTGPGRPDLAEDFSPVDLTVAAWRDLLAQISALHDPSVDARMARALAGGAPSTPSRSGVGSVVGNGDTADVLRQAVMADPLLWLRLLDPGWTVTSVNGGRMGLKRPDYADPTEGNESGNVQDGVLVVFSESVPWASGCTREPMSVGRALARCWFADDFAAAMRAVEAAADDLVLNGVAPEETGPFGAWPADLLEAVHTAREAERVALAALIAPAGSEGSEAGGAAPGPDPDLPGENSSSDDDPLDLAGNPPPPERPDLRVVPGEGGLLITPVSAEDKLRAQIEREALTELRRTLAQTRAREMYITHVQADPDLMASELAAETHRQRQFTEARAVLRREESERLAEGLSAQVAADIFAEPDPEPVWGADRRILWASGQALTVVGPTGVGKSWLTQQLVRAMLGGEPSAATDAGPDVLGLPVRRFDRVLYLAADRPMQIKGLMRAFLSDMHASGALGSRLLVWPGPTPVSPVGPPQDFVDWLCRVGADTCGWGPRPAGVLGEGLALPDVVVFDSLKDFIPDLNQPTDPGAYNNTRQRLVSLGVEVLEMHHTKKADASAIDKAFGSGMLSAGSGSVVVLAGDPGAEDVTLTHAKQPLEVVGPLALRHDRGRLVTRVVTSLSAPAPAPAAREVLVVRAAGAAGITKRDLVDACVGPVSSDSSEYKKVSRWVDRNLAAGVLAAVPGTEGRHQRFRMLIAEPGSEAAPDPVDVTQGESDAPGEGPDAW